MKYVPLFELRFVHPYYADGKCADVQAEPMRETERLLHNHRCVVKPFYDGLRVTIAAAGDGTPLVPVRDGEHFGFRLRLLNPAFALFTDLTAYRLLVSPAYTNAGQGGNNPQELALVAQRTPISERLTISQPAPNEPFVLGGRPLPALKTADFTVEGLGAVAHPVDFDAGAKIVRVDTSGAQAGDSFTIGYAGTPSPTRDTFADAEIHYAAPADDAVPRFQIAFAAREVRWNYYLVTDETHGEFTITDQDAAPLLFARDDLAALDPQALRLDAVARSLASQYPTMQRFRFVSDRAVPCRAAARKSIQLQLDDNAMRKPLPNPPLANATVVELGGNLGAEEAVYQVIKVLNP